MMRIEVKVIGSIAVRFSASRQSSELAANAIMASRVRIRSRLDRTAGAFEVMNM